MISNLGGPVNILVIVISILVALVIHEFMHAYVGHLLGDTTAHDAGRLSLNPLKHIDPFMTVILPIATLLLFGAPFLAAKPVPFDPDRVKYDEFGAAMIAAAGPLTNLVLAFATSVIIKAFALSGFIGNALVTFTLINIAIFIFNLIPIPPLDGSRVLYAFAPEPLQEFMRNIEPYGFFIIIIVVFTVGQGGILQNINHYVQNLLL